MKRHLLRSSLCILASGFMLAACGGAPEATLAPSDEALGTQEAALDCAGATTSVNVQGGSSYGGVFSGGGTWSATYPASAVALEYYIDDVKRGGPEYLTGTNNAGSWSFNDGPVSCGSHTFKVVASPAQYNSSTGAYAKCTSTGVSSATYSFTQSCPTATLSCAFSSSTAVTCTGSASGGTGSPYTAHWRKQILYDNGSSYLGNWYQDTFTESFYCKQTMLRTPADRLTISFKARDNSGMESTAKSSTFYCAP